MIGYGPGHDSDKTDPRRKLGFAHGLAIPGNALSLREDTLVVCDTHDVAMVMGDQVLGGAERGLKIVDCQDVGFYMLKRPIHRNHRHASFLCCRQVIVLQPDRHHQQTGHFSLHHDLGFAPLQIFPVRRSSHQCHKSRLPRSLLNCAAAGCKERISQIGNDKSKHAGAVSF